MRKADLDQSLREAGEIREGDCLENSPERGSDSMCKGPRIGKPLSSLRS